VKTKAPQPDKEFPAFYGTHRYRQINILSQVRPLYDHILYLKDTL